MWYFCVGWRRSPYKIRLTQKDLQEIQILEKEDKFLQFLTGFKMELFQEK